MLDNPAQSLVSIIVPTYNRAHLLGDALDSVWAQTYRPIELIVVDDNSSDDTSAVVKAWKHKNLDNDNSRDFVLKFISLGVNSGPGAAREAGRLQAMGDYLCYLDSDDLLHTQKIEKQVDLLLQNPDAGACYCSSREFSTLPLNGNEKSRQRSDQSFSTFLPTILSGRPWGTAACLWTRKATDQIGPWFPGRAYEDFEYEARAGCRNIHIVFLPEVLCYYRVRRVDSDGFHRGRVLEVPAMISLARNLDQFGKLSDQITNRLLITHLYTRGLWLIMNGDKNPGREYLDQILRLSTVTWRMKLLLHSVNFLGYLFHTNFPARLAKKLGPSFFI